jgi:hypothetical protein
VESVLRIAAMEEEFIGQAFEFIVFREGGPPSPEIYEFGKGKQVHPVDDLASRKFAALALKERRRRPAAEDLEVVCIIKGFELGLPGWALLDLIKKEKETPAQIVGEELSDGLDVF